VANVKEILTVCSLSPHRFHVERFNLEEVNQVEAKVQYRVKALNNVGTERVISRAWQTMGVSELKPNIVYATMN
jgi:hypothetical protein